MSEGVGRPAYGGWLGQNGCGAGAGWAEGTELMPLRFLGCISGLIPPCAFSGWSCSRGSVIVSFLLLGTNQKQ